MSATNGNSSQDKTKTNHLRTFTHVIGRWNTSAKKQWNENQETKSEREREKKRKKSLYLHRVAALARWLRVEKLVFFKYTDGTVNILHRPFRTRSRRRVFTALKLEGFSFRDELSFFSLFYKEVEVYKSFSKWAAKNHNKVAIRNGISIPPTLWPHLHAIFPWLY